MARSIPNPALSGRPDTGALLELLKPITWFAPMWAFACGVASGGGIGADRWWVLASGIALCGPLVCGTSQAVNDWFDRHVDAINQPDRPIPSGRVPGLWGWHLAMAWSVLSLAVGAMLGLWAWAGTLIGLALAWAYSAPPLRLKENGWWGNAAVGLCYEGLPWFTGAAIACGGLPSSAVLLMAGLYSVGAHGIMTLNDFKSIEGDVKLGVRSLPVQLGPARAARLACVVMAAPQVAVIAALFAWGHPWHAATVVGLLVAQLLLMRRLLTDPRANAPWYNATGTTLYVLGMLATAFAIAPGA